MKLPLLILLTSLLIYYFYFYNTTISIAVIPELFTTEFNRKNNIDSMIIYKDWIIGTAKESHSLMVYNWKQNGTLVKKYEEGFQRPNGISLLLDNYIVVVERDGHQMKLISIPDLKIVQDGIGRDELKRPYGSTSGIIHFKNITHTIVDVFVTDNYMKLDDNKKYKVVPPMNELHSRIHQYRFYFINSIFSKWELVNQFGDTSGRGVLYIVESIVYDSMYDNLLIADEHEHVIKVYNKQGQFKHIIMGAEQFVGEPEGFVLYECHDKGFWIATDQLEPHTNFHIFDRVTLQHVTTFRGEETRKTDGVAISQEYDLFCAAHGDASIACFDLKQISKHCTSCCVVT